jgi:superoxide dismutase, Fe-Mn family
MAYSAKNFDHLLGTPGFSDDLLTNHFTLYKGYVENTNKLIEEMADALKQGKNAASVYDVKSRFGFEFNGMKLHELYFEGMTRNGGRFPADTMLATQMKKDFGSVHHWEKSFRAVGGLRGVGWALLAYDAEVQRLHNVWINEHHGRVGARLYAGLRR